MDRDANQQSYFDLNHILPDSKYYTPQEFISNFDLAPETFSLLHINSRSLNKNYDNFETFLYSLNNFPFSVIGITETWLHSVSPNLFNLQNYQMIRNDRTGRRGGGVAFYIQDQLQFKVRYDLSLKESESLFIEIQNSKEKNIIIGLIYRPPNTQIDSFYGDLESVFDTLSPENKILYLMGDFNIDLLSQNNNHERFLQVAYSNACYPHISKPTRIDTRSSTLIDNIFSNIYDADVTSGLLYSEISDHLPIFVICNTNMFNININNSTTFRKETAQNIESFKNDLTIEDWSAVYSQQNANIAYEIFNNKLQLYYDKNFPIVTSKKSSKRGKKPWITTAILKSIHARNKLYKIYLNEPNTYNSNKYKKYRNKLTDIIRTSRKMHYSDKLNQVKSNIKATWEIIKDLMGKKPQQLPKENFTMNGNIINPDDTVNTFNSYFVNLGPNLAKNFDRQNKDFAKFLPEPTPSSLFFNPTNPNEIINITKELNSSKSKGHDRISTFLLKQIIHVIVSPLTHIFNISIATGKVPRSLKIAKVNPVYKKEDPHEISNFRPISILPSISKILEKIIHKRLHNFLNIHKLLNNNQFGFRKNYSTDLALVQLLRHLRTKNTS